MKISNLLLEERFRLRQEKAKTLGSKALDRQQVMAEGYRKALTEYLSIIDGLPSSGSITQSAIQNLQSFLNKILPKRKRPIIGSLPYKHLNLPSQQPTSASSITPAYLGGNKTVSPDDGAATPEAPISTEIAALAQSLNWSPVSIYEYVKNNIDTEWYWGCMKGAEETLHQKSGNDCDQAALLTALLRASGFPTRYVRGVIQFFPDIERAKHLTGIDDPNKIAEFFQKSGIPNKPVIQGGKIANFQLEHIWVESQIPYSNYRGAIIDTMGKTWLGLDTSIKVKGYTYNNPPDILSVMSLSATRDEYLGFASSMTGTSPFVLNQTPLEYLRASVNAQLIALQLTTTYSSYLSTRTLVPEVLHILPASLQFTQVKVTNEYTAIPDELIHKVRFTTVNSQTTDQLFSITVPVYKLSNQQAVIKYEPETIQDQETIDSYGGMDNTPAYLVHLRPVLSINNERVIVAQNGLAMGSAYSLTLDVISPNSTEQVNTDLVVGNLVVIGITAQKAVIKQQLDPNAQKDAERLLYEEAMHYADRWRSAEDELASLLQTPIARPIPSLEVVGGVINVAYLLDVPHGFTWKGVYMDASLRAVEIVKSSGTSTSLVETFTVQSDQQKLFMQLSSLQGSILENRIFEDDFQVSSVSTAKLLQHANQGSGGMGQGSVLLTIDKSNIATVLPTLPFDDNIKEDIINSVNQNSTIRIPNSALTYQDWTGIGYIKENPETGESGWMLSGMIAGGMTAVKKELWINQDIADELSLPFTPGVNNDPGSAVSLVRINRSAGDYQKNTVGMQLAIPFEVMARDSTGKAVKNVPVTFAVTAGIGALMSSDDQGNPVIGTQLVVKTGSNGIAWAVLTLGQKTADSPYWLQDTPNWTLAGLNQVSVSAQSAMGTLYTDKPFEAYGLPGKARTISIVSGDGLYGKVNAFAGTIKAIVQDQYTNPVSNQMVTFTSQPQDFGPSTPAGTIQNAEIFGNTADCPMPAILSCPNAKTSLSKATDSSGALAYVIMGNTDDTLYTIRATTQVTDQSGQPKNAFVDFRYYVGPQPRTGAGNIADPYLSVMSVYGTDDKDRNIDAGIPGQAFSAPLTAAMYFTREIPTDPTSCLSTRIFTTEPVTDGSMQFTVKQGGGSVKPEQVNSSTNGQYPTTLTLGPNPIKNTVQADGAVTRTVQKADLTGKCVQASIDYKASTTFDVWGVKATLQPTQLILLNEGGYPIANTLIPYTVQPSDYQYAKQNIFLNIYENDAWMGMIQADANGVITISPGAAKFDATKTYTSEIIVNSGGSIQIKSDKVPLPVGQLRVLTDESPAQTADEIKFSDGSDHSKGTKKYHIAIQSQTWLSSCATLTGRIATLSTATATLGQPVSLSHINTGYASQHPIHFISSRGVCYPKITDTVDGYSDMDKFIISNRPRADLDVGLPSNVYNTAVLYAGIGNQFMIEVGGVQKVLPIEPVGVVILGIDGMRQDVLYKHSDDSTNEASYDDPNGCGIGTRCYVELGQVKGLCAVMGGKYSETLGISSCDPTGAENKYMKLPNVTTIFPSITFAAWASIFSGKMPNETGILGNEFFARDLYNPNVPNNSVIPGLDVLPSGMVTLDADGGAFSPGGAQFALSHVTPVEFSLLGYFAGADTLIKKMNLSAPNRVLVADPLWADINSMVDKKYAASPYYSDARCDQSTFECRTVSMFNQYTRGYGNTRGADWWGTPSLTWANAFNTALSQKGLHSEAALLDESSAGEAKNFISAYFSQLNSSGKRKRFPSVLSVYLPGIDHYAHLEGMKGYVNFFKNKTDVQVKNIVDALKGQDEFDNKIFIITADHGHTAMPTDLKYKRTRTWEDEGGTPHTTVDYPDAEMSCELKLDFANPNNATLITNAMRAELANNNLHIWELADFLKTVGEFVEQATSQVLENKILAPKEISKLFLDPATGQPLRSGAAEKIENANVIAAMNGPMAHIYVKGSDWSAIPDNNRILEVAEIFRVTLQGARGGDSPLLTFPAGMAERFGYKIGRLSNSIDEILVRDGGVYKVYTVGNASVSLKVLGSLSSEYIDATNRIEKMNNVDRSGDIVLIMKDNTSGNALDRYTTGVACKAWHGSLSRSDSYVPFIFAYPGGNRIDIENILKKDTLCTTDYSNCKGNWKLTDTVKEIIKGQYQ